MPGAVRCKVLSLVPWCCVKLLNCDSMISCFYFCLLLLIASSLTCMAPAASWRVPVPAGSSSADRSASMTWCKDCSMYVSASSGSLARASAQCLIAMHAPSLESISLLEGAVRHAMECHIVVGSWAVHWGSCKVRPSKPAGANNMYDRPLFKCFAGSAKDTSMIVLKNTYIPAQHA